MMRASPWIQTSMVGNLRTESFPITRTRISFPLLLCSCQAESGGREHSTLTIRDTPTPHCESLIKEHGDVLVDAVESFPNLPGKETPLRASKTSSSHRSKKLKVMAQMSEIRSGGKIPPNILYCLELGMDIDQIKSMTCKHPGFVYYSLEGKIKPMVKFLLEIGVNPSDIPSILRKSPQLCGLSLTENLMPTMTYLENLGVDKKKWAKVIYRCPALLTYSRQKFNSTVDYLYELGLTAEHVGKILTRFPSIVGYSVEENLRPTAEYFRSMGVDVAILVYRAPQVFGLSIERNLKPMTKFFLEKGYTIEEVGAMISRFGCLFCYSLLANIIPKWEFFLLMDYPTSDLVKFPQYFGCSLENRIKPRYALVRESGVKMLLSKMLYVAEPEFEKVLMRKMKTKMKTKMKKQLHDLGSNMEGLKL